MANMIIRPATGTGNKVILQDQAGAAVMTTADSGATIADGVALGTPASGVVTNLTGTLGANIAFPAGHILQVVSNNYNSQTELSSQIQLCPVTITTKAVNSNFYYLAMLTVGGIGDTDNFELKMTKTAGGTAVNTDYLPTDNRAPGTTAQTNGHIAIVDVMVQSVVHNTLIWQTYNFSDTIIASDAKGATITFALWGDGGAWINRPPGRANYETGVTSLTIMEIGA